MSLYAALVNLGLQLFRLKDVRTGWRYRVLDAGADGLKLKTLHGSVLVPWSAVQGMHALDARHLAVVLPSPLPAGDRAGGIAGGGFHETEAEPAPGAPPVAPEKYALVLHEQELGSTIPEAEARLTPLARAGRVT